MFLLLLWSGVKLEEIAEELFLEAGYGLVFIRGSLLFFLACFLVGTPVWEPSMGRSYWGDSMRARKIERKRKGKYVRESEEGGVCLAVMKNEAGQKDKIKLSNHCTRRIKNAQGSETRTRTWNERTNERHRHVCGYTLVNWCGWHRSRW